MKIYFLFLFISLGLLQCTRYENQPIPSIKQRSIDLMRELKPKLAGTWEVGPVQIKHKNLGYFQVPSGITKDTVLPNLAQITLQPASGPNQRTPLGEQYAEFTGTLQIGTKTFPIYASMMAGPSRQTTGQLQGYLGLQYNFPIGDVHRTSVEEDYLGGIGLMNDTFSVEVGESEMIWRGLNRAIDSARLKKR